VAAPRVEIYPRRGGGFDWRFVARNGEILGGSDQGYTERNDAREGWRRLEYLVLEAWAFAPSPASAIPIEDVEEIP